MLATVRFHLPEFHQTEFLKGLQVR